MSPIYKSGIDKEIEILRSAVESTNEGFITIDQDHTVILYNKGAEKIFGYKAEEVLGKDLDLILTQDCAPNHYKITDNLAFMHGGNFFVGKNKNIAFK